MAKLSHIIGGVVTGTLNGLLGAGGGMVAVPILKRSVPQKKAHATSVCIIFPICLASAVMYIINGKVTYSDVSPYLLWGALGAALGTYFLRKINDRLLKKIFALVMLWAGIRLVLK